MISDDLGKLFAEMDKHISAFHDKHGELELENEIKFPCEISEVISQGFGESSRGFKEIGSTVRVRPVNDEKTYLGIYLGDLSHGVSIAKGSKSKSLLITNYPNPAMWVPELNKVVWGCSSWWSIIEKKEDLEKMITDSDIENIWYVKALKEMGEKNEKKD